MTQVDSENAASLREQLLVLRQSYGSRLQEKVNEILEHWRQCQAVQGEQRQEQLTILHRLTHTVAGSGATFGFPEAGARARCVEGILKNLLETGEPLGDGSRLQIDAALESLREAAVGAATSSGAPRFAESQLDLAEGDNGEVRGRRVLYLFTDGEVPEWSHSLNAFGYEVEIVTTPDQLRQAATAEAPAVIVTYCTHQPFAITSNNYPLSAALAEIHRDSGTNVPVIWTSRAGDLETRLQAVRLGGTAFFAEPVDVDALLVKIDDLTAEHSPEPFRVLIVDDEASLGRLFSLILKQAGMLTQVVTDPLQVMGPLVDFRPDLILMDVYMPGCSGIELATVIRQQEAYVGIPIVFLSVETDMARQLAAMRQGGDDFLIKPIQPRALISAVTTRATRARVLQNLMVRDSLTGLLNHTKCKEQMAIELDRARRQGHPMTLAMIDLDHFKSVNDKFGHPTGDRVLRSLSRLLCQRLRQTDVIGRYGGEEFAVIMSGTDKESSMKVIDNVRAAFASLMHWSEGEEFRVTFSAGLATAPPHTQLEALSEAADKALYEAKRRGRNQIVAADDSELWANRKPL